jgi:hypothetical protein
MMDDLVHAWNRLNEILNTYPAVPYLVSFLVGLILFLFRRVRETAGRYFAVVSVWIVGQFHRWLRAACASLGIARLEDLERLRKEFAGVIRRAPEASVQAESPNPTSVERLGTKIGLHENIWQYLGKKDPHQMDSRTIDVLLKSPFCKKCSYVLTEWNSSLREYCVCNLCPHCSETWAAGQLVKLDAFKDAAYKLLDAEMRRTGTLKPTEENS